MGKAPQVSAECHLGVVAGGHPATAQAGAAVLRAGGNAADAAVAAVCAAMTAEAALTGLGAGGFALVREPDGRAELLDFFVAASGRGRSADDHLARSRLHPYEVPFRATTQLFNVGPASCAVPGIAPGLAALHARHGRLPLREVVAPAIRLAREGAVLVPPQDYLHDILEGLLTGTRGMRRVFAPEGRLLRAGEIVRVPGLEDALVAFAQEGATPFTHGRYATRLAEFMDAEGGLITSEDLRSYQVIPRPPVSIPYRGWRILTNPLPSSGGTLIAFALGLLDRIGLDHLGPTLHTETLVRAFVATERARGSGFDLHLRKPGFAETFLAQRHLDEYTTALWPAGTPQGPHHDDLGPSRTDVGNTTHVSAIDREGLAVSVTSSCGSGSGVLVEGTGIIMNNMMGEADLNPGGFFTLPPGERLTSMMAPTIASGPARAFGHRAPGQGAAAGGGRGCLGGEAPAECDLIALGSAGSARLRSAISQVIVGMVDDGLWAQEAIDRPRVHVDPAGDEPTIHLEGGIADEIAAHLKGHGYRVHLWPVRDLYFGGAQVAGRFVEAEGTRFDGGGDPRRGGAAVFA